MLTIKSKVWQFLDGEDISPWLNRIGVKNWWDGNVLHIEGQVRTSIHRELDPATCYACLALGIFGVFWPWVLGDDFKQLNKEWRERVKRRGKSTEATEKEGG